MMNGIRFLIGIVLVGVSYLNAQSIDLYVVLMPAKTPDDQKKVSLQIINEFGGNHPIDTSYVEMKICFRSNEKLFHKYKLMVNPTTFYPGIYMQYRKEKKVSLDTVKSSKDLNRLNLEHDQIILENSTGRFRFLYKRKYKEGVLYAHITPLTPGYYEPFYITLPVVSSCKDSSYYSFSPILKESFKVQSEDNRVRLHYVKRKSEYFLTDINLKVISSNWIDL